MEFNAMSQYRPTPDRFLFPHQRPRTATQIMYPSNGFHIPPQPNQPISHAQPHQPYPGWPINGTPPRTFPMQRRSTFLGDPRSQPSDTPASRPTSMSAQTMRNLGLSKPRLIPHSSFDSVELWPQKPVPDFDITSLEPEMSDFAQSMMTAGEDTPIIDLRQSAFEPDSGQDAYRNSISSRMSESSISMSSNGPMAEVPSVEDFSASDMSYIDCDWSNLEPAKTLLSPMASPRPQQHDMLRSNSRSRASPNPHPNMRTSPYTMESNRNKRWSTGMYASTPVPSRPMHQFSNRYSFYGSPLNPQNSMPTMPDISNAFQSQTQNLLYSQPTLQSSTTTLFSSPDQPFPEAPRPLPSQGLFRLLQSNADRLTGYASHFADLSDPPDLYTSLNDEPSNPPESDMNPSDPELAAHEQDLRFTGDLYTPRWVRGHGNKREGWCGLCKPGRWLVLKNSAFWYDKSFTHGVSAATGAAFQGPQETRRTEGNLDVWEGLCGSCGDWIPLVSSKKKGTTWFRHAYKCHTHAKVKENVKRRRETSSMLRPRAASNSSNYGVNVANTSSNSTQSSSTASAVDTPTSSEAPKVEASSSTPYLTPQLAEAPFSTPHISIISNLSPVVDEQPLDYQDGSKQDHHADHADLHNSLPGFHIDSNGVQTINFASMI